MSVINFNQEKFFEFLLNKDFCLDDLEAEMSDALFDDIYNCGTAEKALEISHALYAIDEMSDNDQEDNAMEFVSDFMQYCQNEIIMKWAKNLGMVHSKGYEKIEISNARVANEIKRFKNMSSYEFSQWKLRVEHYND